MKYVNNVEIGKKIIIKKYPEFINSNFYSDNSGWTNFVIKVDNKYIFRFPRNDEAYRAIKVEYDILKYLNKELPKNIKVPNYIYSNLDKDYPFVGYKMIQGEFLSEKLYNNFNESEKHNFINNILTFLNTLHKIDVKQYQMDFVEPISNYKMRYEEFKNVCFKYFDEKEKMATIELFENYFKDEKMTCYKPTVIHGDLSTDHIIITDDGIGIIDFGDTRIFDPAYDFIWAYLIDNELFEDLLNKYNGNKDDYFKYRIKEFYKKRTAYYGIVYADEIKDKKLLEEQLNDLRKNLFE